MSANDVLVPFTHSSVANTPEFRILNDDTGLWVIALNVTLYLHLSQLQGFVTMSAVVTLRVFFRHDQSGRLFIPIYICES